MLNPYSVKKSHQTLIGFAAETEQLEKNAVEKLHNKNLDMIAANRVGQDPENKQDIGFNNEYNALHVFWPGGNTELKYSRKSVLANQLIQLIATQYQHKKQNEKNTA